MDHTLIDWTNTSAKITPHFTVGEATYLPSWKIHHSPSDEEKQNIIKMAEKLEIVRNFIGSSISVHVWIRPESVNCPSSPYHGANYNSFIGGAKKSAHRLGLAVDFHVPGYTCDSIRQLLLPKLEEFDLRLEDNSPGEWIHLGNDWVPGKTRFFKP